MHWFASHLIYLILTKPTMQQCFIPVEIFALQIHHIYARGIVVNPPLELDILQKRFCLRKGY